MWKPHLSLLLRSYFISCFYCYKNYRAFNFFWPQSKWKSFFLICINNSTVPRLWVWKWSAVVWSQPQTLRLPRSLACLKSHESVRREALQTLFLHVITQRSRRLPDQRPRRLKSLSAECDLVKEGIKYWSVEKMVNKAGFRCVAGSPAVRVKHWQNCYGSRLRQTKNTLQPARSEHTHKHVCFFILGDFQ